MIPLPGRSPLNLLYDLTRTDLGQCGRSRVTHAMRSAIDPYTIRKNLP